MKSLLWAGELGREGGVGAQTVRRLADAGKISCYRDAKNRRRFPLEAVEELRAVMGLKKNPVVVGCENERTS